jgi:hypothetical protein
VGLVHSFEPFEGTVFPTSVVLIFVHFLRKWPTTTLDNKLNQAQKFTDIILLMYSTSVKLTLCKAILEALPQKLPPSLNERTPCVTVSESVTSTCGLFLKFKKPDKFHNFIFFNVLTEFVKLAS